MTGGQPAHILYECQNLTLSTGTGIATYARNLSLEARKLGYRTSALLGVGHTESVMGTVLDEIRLHDACKTPAFSLRTQIQEIWGHYYADKPGVTAARVPYSGLVVEPDQGRFRESFDDIYAVPQLIDRGYRHFMRYGKPMPVSGVGGIDLFHATHVVPLAVPDVPSLYTIHDIIPLRLPYATLGNKKYFHDLVRHLVDHSTHIVTVSEYSRQDLVRFFNVPESRITNTYQSVEIDALVAGASEDEIAQCNEHAFGVEHGEYYVFCGAIEPKKNISRLVEAYAASGVKRPLLLAGNLGWQYDQDVRRINDERFDVWRLEDGVITKQRSVRHLNYLSRRSLLRLIRGARAMVFPSLYEGFGLPILEAMALGTPVITSSVSSLPEIAGDAALLVDPYDVDSIAKAFRTLDVDENLRRDLAARGRIRAEAFSPTRHRERLDALYRDVLSGRG